MSIRTMDCLLVALERQIFSRSIYNRCTIILKIPVFLNIHAKYWWISPGMVSAEKINPIQSRTGKWAVFDGFISFSCNSAKLPSVLHEKCFTIKWGVIYINVSCCKVHELTWNQIWRRNSSSFGIHIYQCVFSKKCSVHFQYGFIAYDMSCLLKKFDKFFFYLGIWRWVLPSPICFGDSFFPPLTAKTISWPTKLFFWSFLSSVNRLPST